MKRIDTWCSTCGIEMVFFIEADCAHEECCSYCKEYWAKAGCGGKEMEDE